MMDRMFCSLLMGRSGVDGRRLLAVSVYLPPHYGYNSVAGDWASADRAGPQRTEWFGSLAFFEYVASGHLW
ncbi:MAG: hypothetical protein QOD69_1178 [Solirubrobacteraceae bacterium]|jgi:hypothetical protein|nr:hypothetical protein [Solirubrobacteraceae bacterium]